ncbi:MAG: hypothetical protein NTX28_12455 [Novosphingobium sp.]|nr:hypothetical protein [Novosphingobium sp.]
MFGPRLSTVFASRWKALWWAASILLLAWSVVPSADETAEQTGASPAAARTPHADPWAKDPKPRGGATSP